jgi:hypothetical protein
MLGDPQDLMRLRNHLERGTHGRLTHDKGDKVTQIFFPTRRHTSENGAEFVARASPENDRRDRPKSPASSTASAGLRCCGDASHKARARSGTSQPEA